MVSLLAGKSSGPAVVPFDWSDVFADLAGDYESRWRRWERRQEREGRA